MVLHLVFEVIKVGMKLTSEALKLRDELEDIENKTKGHSGREYVEGERYQGTYIHGVGPEGYGSLRFKTGGLYQGTFSGGKMEGFGVLTYFNGYRYEGSFSQSKRSGKGCLYTPENILIYTGEWAEDQRNGYGTSFYGTNGRISFAGNWKDDMREEGLWYYSSGIKLYEGKFQNNKMFKGVHYADIGEHYGYWYDGDFVDDHYCGQGVQHTSTGDYKGEFKDHKRNGLGVFTFIKDDVAGRIEYTGHWANGKKNGFGKETKTNGDIYEGEWKDNLKQGKGKFTYHTGIVTEGTWKGSKLDGPSKIVLANGNIMEGSYVDGKKEGNWSYTDVKTNKSYPQEYKNDVLISKKS